MGKNKEQKNEKILIFVNKSYIYTTVKTSAISKL